MATRRRQTSTTAFPQSRHSKGVQLTITISENSFSVNKDGNRNVLEDFQHLLRANGFQIARATNPTVAENVRFIKITLTTNEYGKAIFFEKLRRAWCCLICSRGDSFWLESAEPHRDIFKHKFDDPRQVLQAPSFSFGSFFDCGTYIRHWSSEDDVALIENGNIQVEFEHDAKLLAITFFKEGEPDGFKEVRIEMEYRQLENYVVVDENDAQKSIKFYFPLQWPPKVFQEIAATLKAVRLMIVLKLYPKNA